VVWRFDVAHNRLTVDLVPGGGPFGGTMLSGATLDVGGHHGHRRVAVTVAPGRTTRLQAGVSSLWFTSVPIVLVVPPAPALVGSEVEPDTLILQFSLPVRAGGSACGVSPADGPATTLRFPRGPHACSGRLTVVARSGERSSLLVSVPARVPLTPAFRDVPISFGPAGSGAYYITIDDGGYPDPQVLDLMRAYHVPITAFLIQRVAAQHLDYWRAFVAAGGEIEDHTVSHPDLTRLSPAEVFAQWAGAAQADQAWFGASPTLGRPPYGATNRMVEAAARQAGLRVVVLWSASMYNGQLTTYDHRPLRAGEIVILHWVPGLFDSVVRLLSLGAAQGLHPAPLAASLAAASPG
jgi:peptidoglycan/xylan/chitin deacetylase (PgdA/CDA1 family)